MNILISLLFVVSSWANLPLASYDLSVYGESAKAKISRYFEVVRDEEGQWEAFVPQDQQDFFRALAPLATPKAADISAELRHRLQEFSQQRFLFGYKYHSWDEFLLWMKNLQETNPTLVNVVEYGKSAQGRPLQAIRLSGQNPKGTILITAATHGDELITSEVVMDFVNRLVLGYGNENRVTRILNELEIYFVPVVNPDGFVKVQRYDSGQDPNRSYPYPERTNANPTASIAGLLSLFHSKNFMGTLDFHAFGEMIMYPWAYTRTKIPEPDKSHFHQLTQTMAKENRYQFGPISEVIYIAPGSSADYYYWKTRSTSVAVEIGRSKVPNPNQFPTIFESQAESTFQFIESFLASRE
jgi:hypothetical protein